MRKNLIIRITLISIYENVRLTWQVPRVPTKNGTTVTLPSAKYEHYQVIVRVDSLHIIACRSTRQLLVVFSHDGCKNCRYWLDISETQCCPTDGVHLIALGRVCKLNWGG